MDGEKPGNPLRKIFPPWRPTGIGEKEGKGSLTPANQLKTPSRPLHDGSEGEISHLPDSCPFPCSGLLNKKAIKWGVLTYLLVVGKI